MLVSVTPDGDKDFFAFSAAAWSFKIAFVFLLTSIPMIEKSTEQGYLEYLRCMK